MNKTKPSIPTDYRFVNLTGKRYGRLKVLSYHGKKKGHKLWQCLCDCGKITICHGTSLKKGDTNSCGCFRVEFLAEKRTTHGLTNTPEYMTWTNMKTRCYNTAYHLYPNYGGRGIKVCDRWLNSFESFLEDMGPRPLGTSIDRFPDKDGNYEPGNCRWATSIQQQNNNSRNKFIEFNGKTMTLAQWSRETGIGIGTIRNRMKSGWPMHLVLTIIPQASGLKASFIKQCKAEQQTI